MNIALIIPIRRLEAFDNPAFLFELKYDGFRALADTVNGRMLSKNVNRMRRFEKLGSAIQLRVSMPLALGESARAVPGVHSPTHGPVIS